MSHIIFSRHILKEKGEFLCQTILNAPFGMNALDDSARPAHHVAVNVTAAMIGEMTAEMTVTYGIAMTVVVIDKIIYKELLLAAPILNLSYIL